MTCNPNVHNKGWVTILNHSGECLYTCCSLPANWDQSDFLEIGAESESVCDVSTQYTTGYCSENPRRCHSDFTVSHLYPPLQGQGFAGNKLCSPLAAEAHGQHGAECTQGSVCASPCPSTSVVMSSHVGLLANPHVV